MTVHIGSNALIGAGVVVLLGVGAVAAGWIPLSQLLWFGLVLICPLLMFFMMRGGMQHGGQPDRRDVDVEEPSRR